jgi:enterochelin esterase family protein
VDASYQPPPAAPEATADAVRFGLADPDSALAAVRLLPALSLPDPAPEFDRADGGWALRLPRPPVWRMEYRLELRHADGGTEEICDPANPLRAPGAFGEKSVVEFPDYAAPRWLAADRAGGGTVDLPVPSRALGHPVAVRVWSPAGAEPAEVLPLLVAHDGPEYERLACLTGYAAAMVAGPLPPFRLALLAPGERNEEYSANPAYARALAREVLPAVRRAVGVTGPVVGLGVSLGGLALLHAQRRHPGVFGGLFLQSGSFFDRRLDPQEEERFGRFPRVSRFVAETLRHAAPCPPVRATLTCGLAEENLANNRQMTAGLAAQGYAARLVEVPDAHNFIAWRDALDPALTDLLATLWAGSPVPGMIGG